MATKKDKEVVMNMKLQLALRGYVPEFANADDLRIMNDLTKLHKKLESIDSKKMRDLEHNKELTALTAKMKEIQRDEQNLLNRITKRNLDF